jgi:poly-beta-1,6-N-acetyl-D-glucosamine synthase
MNLIPYVLDIFTYVFMIYSVAIIGFYIFIGVYSIGETKQYMARSSFTNYGYLAASEHAPAISIIAPAYNEGATIIENVRSLLSIHYNNFEIIIVNDGSKDNSLQQLIQEYSLVLSDCSFDQHIVTKEVRGIYLSEDPVYRKLTVVDKVNGGKADALNVGVNVARNAYVVCIDVDCILEQDAMLKLIKPFLDDSGRRVIATGGVVRVANSCEVQDGKIVQVNLPNDFLPRVQTLEYIRAFLLGRMAWSRMNGLLLISGAFGAFDRDILISAGGYDHRTVGEDMELVVRMRRYMEERNLPYKVAYIPDPLCWTEAPNSYKILGRQRNRWTRGTIETLKLHRRMFFNRRYGVLGLLSYPYWFFFEFLAPIVEFAGLLFFLFCILIGATNWSFFLALFLLVYTFSVLYSVFAILMEVMTYNKYKKRSEIVRLVLTAMAEPFIFHPFVVWASIQGNIDLLRKKNAWGEMSRQGFAKKRVSGT